MKDVFPKLFSIASLKNAIVGDLRERERGEGGHWEVQFRRPFQDWEIEEVIRFLELIYLLQVQE